MKKRILSLVLTVLMIVTMLSAINIPVYAAATSFTVNPSVLIGGGNEYNIVWENNVVSVGWVTYNYKGKTYTVYDEENGVVRSDDKLHTVRVPMEHLDGAGSYEVHAEGVVSRNGYDIQTSGKSSIQRTFKGFKGSDNLRIGFISDTHLLVNNKKKYESMLNSVKTAVDNYMNKPDLVVLNGDITNNMQYEEEFYGLFDMFEICGHDGTTPVLYVVGNHEKRGKFSIEMEKYLTYNTGEYYTSFDLGPASIIVTDIGEDKADDSIEYGGLTDMDHYFEEQYDWLQLHPGYTDGAKYTFSIGHSPSYLDRYLKSEMAAVFYNLGTDVHIAGHSHKSEYYKGGTSIVVHDGGHDNNEKVRTTLVTLNGGKYTFKGFDANGATILENTLTAGNKGASVKTVKSQGEVYVKPSEPVTTTEKTETEILPTAAGVSTMTLKGAADTTALTTKPVVFEAGDYFNIVWQSTWGVPCAGYVEISGEAKQWKDSHGGKLRTETTHSVRIPKEKLSGKTYTVKSRVVMNYNAYGNYNANNPTTYGPYASASPVKLQPIPYDGQVKYTIIAVANKSGGRDDAKKLKDVYKSTSNANLLVLLGDMTDNLNDEQNFGKTILDYANEITGGEYPVMFLRGENETKGAFAANLNRFIRPMTTEQVTNRFYQSYSHGSNYSFIGLDTATEDSDSASAYRGYAGFDKLRAEQVDWLNSLPKAFPGQYNIVFGNARDLKNAAGVDFTKNFEKLKIQLAVTAGKGGAQFNKGKDYSTLNVGTSKGVVLTLANEKISIEAINKSVDQLGEIKVEKVAQKENNTVTSKPQTPTTQQKPTEQTKPSEDTNQKQESSSTQTDTPTQKEEQTTPNENTGETVEGEEQKPVKVEGYIKTGWYKDYYNTNISIIKGAEFTLTKQLSEGEFIYILARMCGYNKKNYDDGTSIGRAASWAMDIGLTTEDLGGEEIISEETAKALVNAIFSK